MKGRNANRYPGGIYKKEHRKLIDERARARFWISPKTIPSEIADDCANKGYRPCIDEGHVREMGEQVHHAEVDDRADRAYHREFHKALAFSRVGQDHASPSFCLK